LCRVYEIRCGGVLSASVQTPLLHGVGWYTRNAAPK
jgi:hypothetical protein